MGAGGSALATTLVQIGEVVFLAWVVRRDLHPGAPGGPPPAPPRGRAAHSPGGRAHRPALRGRGGRLRAGGVPRGEAGRREPRGTSDRPHLFVGHLHLRAGHRQRGERPRGAGSGCPRHSGCASSGAAGLCSRRGVHGLRGHHLPPHPRAHRGHHDRCPGDRRARGSTLHGGRGLPGLGRSAGGGGRRPPGAGDSRFTFTANVVGTTWSGSAGAAARLRDALGVLGIWWGSPQGSPRWRRRWCGASSGSRAGRSSHWRSRRPERAGHRISLEGPCGGGAGSVGGGFSDGKNMGP
jgi:hypothetical protein